jgi:uncharacterized protein YjeT (DUF2065 family)
MWYNSVTGFVRFFCARTNQCFCDLKRSFYLFRHVIVWHELLIAICLVMVIEGIMPFLAPKAWQELLLSVSQLASRQIRLIGLASMLIGTALLYIVN